VEVNVTRVTIHLINNQLFNRKKSIANDKQQYFTTPHEKLCTRLLLPTDNKPVRCTEGTL